MGQVFRRLWPAALYVLIVAALLGSLALRGWSDTWRPIVPTMAPVFADMRTVQGAIRSEQLGFDPHFTNPGDPWGRPMNYPGIWLGLAKTIGLDSEHRFLAFVGLYVGAFVVMLFALLLRYPSGWLLAACCSTATFLAVERGNNDLAVFVLVSVGLMCNRGVIAIGCVLLASILKLFPIAASIIWLSKPWRILLTGLGFCLYLGWYWPDIVATMHGVPSSASLSFGTKSIAAWTNFSVRWWVILLLHVSIGMVVWRGMRDQLRRLLSASLTHTFSASFRPDLGKRARLLLGGASIYVLTYAISSSWDYRLIFLILCIPALSSASESAVGRALLVTICVSMFDYWLSRLGIVGRLGVVAAKSITFVLLFAILVECSFAIASSFRAVGRNACGSAERGGAV
mgnify:CR=1 FL=1